MAAYSVASEYLPLKAVLLCKPPRQIGDIDKPQSVLYKKKVDPEILDREYGKIVELYKKLGIRTSFIDPGIIPGTECTYLFNLMFTRDLFFMTPRGAILSRMASGVRRDELPYARRALKEGGVHIRRVIEGSGTFEGADALWINSRTVAIGVGNRTNEDGFRQVENELKGDGTRCIFLPAPRGTLHLLGALQLVDRDLALVRTELVSPEVVTFLGKSRIRVIGIPENAEVREKQALNFVTIAPKKIIMPAGCPLTRKIFKRHGIDIAAETAVTQLINGSGGLACATGILARARRNHKKNISVSAL